MTPMEAAIQSKDMKRELPEGWRWVKLGEVCEIARGGSPRPIEAYLTNSSTGINWIKIGDTEQGGKYIYTTKEKIIPEGVRSSRRVESGDFLLTNSMSFGRPYILRTSGCIHDGWLVIKLNETFLDEEFLYYCLSSPVAYNQFTSIASGGIVRNLKSDSVKRVTIPLPSLPEQKRIAAILRDHMASVEKARAAALERLEAIKALPAAYLRQAFTNPNAKSWPRMMFEQVSVLQRGYDLTEKERQSGSYPVVTSSGIMGTHSEYWAKGPGVVTGRSGSIGRVYYIEEDFWPHNTALYVKDFKDNHPRYIYYLLQWINVKAVSSGSGVPTLDRKEVHKLTVYRPSAEEQEKIAESLTEQMVSVEKARIAAEVELATINALPAALLRRAFSGEL